MAAALWGFAFNQFHYKRPVFNAVDLGDVGVIERGEDLGFPLEAGHSLRVGGEGFR